jgi:hypothetical protein
MVTLKSDAQRCSLQRLMLLSTADESYNSQIFFRWKVEIKLHLVERHVSVIPTSYVPSYERATNRYR